MKAVLNCTLYVENLCVHNNKRTSEADIINICLFYNLLFSASKYDNFCSL